MELDSGLLPSTSPDFRDSPSAELTRPIAIRRDSVSVKRWQKECLRRMLAAHEAAEMQRALADPRFLQNTKVPDVIF